MPYSRPTLTELYNLAAGDVLASLGVGDTLLDWDPMAVLPWTTAQMANLQFGYLDWIARQCVPWTSTGEWLEAWAALVGIFRKAAAAAGNPSVSFSGTATTPIAAGTVLTRQTDNAQFQTTASATWSSGVATAPIVALATGAAGNSAAGTVLTLANPLAGVSSSVTVRTAISGGADQETDDALRTRMLYRYAHPAQGGAQSDYVEWATNVTGVTRAWCIPNGQGPGTVVIYFMMDDAEAAYGGFPQGSNGVATLETRATAATGDQLAVANAIYPLRPTTALVYACAPTADPINFTVNDIAPNTTAMQAAINAALLGAFQGAAGADGTDIYMNAFTAALDAVDGLTQYTLASPTSPIRPAVGVLPTLGTVTYGTSS